VSRLQRVARLEAAQWEQSIMEIAERLAAEFELPLDEVLREARETGERIERWGIDEELRLFGQQHGIGEDEVRARYAEALRDCRSEEQ
jgi:hypothetical protein